MGQSILRYRRKPFRSGVDSVIYLALVIVVGFTAVRSIPPHLPKGNRVNIPEPGIGYVSGGGRAHVRFPAGRQMRQRK
jgi:hypothetical protein